MRDDTKCRHVTPKMSFARVLHWPSRRLVLLTPRRASTTAGPVSSDSNLTNKSSSGARNATQNAH
jgi:hypothetical protein